MRRFYRWTRDLHLYLGLFVSPLVVVFAVSTLILNHPGLHAQQPAGRSGTSTETFHVRAPDRPITMEKAKEILRQVHVTGEIDYLRHATADPRLTIPVTKPGEITRVEVDLLTGTATVERRPQGLAEVLIYLHKMPGPHNAMFRGNWLYTVWWSAMADGFVYAVLFLTLSGLFLWWKIKSDRMIGWALLGTGAMSVMLLAMALSS